jgi:hypothetical protein
VIHVDRSRLRKLVGIGCVVAVIGAAVALAAPSIGDAPPAQDAPGTCLDFARDVNPKEVPVDSGYDPEKDLVYAHHAGRTYVLGPSDPACRSLSGPRAVIDDAVQTDRENEIVTCREIAASVSENRTEVRGRRFDQEAARRYMGERCGSAG